MTSVDFMCDLSQQGTELPHCWEHTVGSCHAPIALRADWQQQLRRCQSELGFRYVRFHGLLSDDVGTVIAHNGQLLYSFFNADQIVDFLLSIGVRPFVELSFMPAALASGSKTVFRYRGNVTPPKDYDEWSLLIHTLVSHWVERYGYAGLFGVLFSCGLGFPLPEDIPLLAAGTMVANGRLDFALVAICAWCGIIGGDCVLYHIGKKFGDAKNPLLVSVRSGAANTTWFITCATQRNSPASKSLRARSITASAPPMYST